MVTRENKDVIHELIDAINANDIDRMVALVSDDFVIHTQVPGIGSGRQGMHQLMSTYFTAFPEQHVDVHAVVSDGDLVAVRHTHHLTHSGEFAGLPPTGKHVVIDGIEMYRISDGKIHEMWHHDDMLGLMQQLGAIPVPA